MPSIDTVLLLNSEDVHTHKKISIEYTFLITIEKKQVPFIFDNFKAFYIIGLKLLFQKVCYLGTQFVC